MPKKILVVDDERHIVRLIQINLERTGYEIVTAFSGKDALEQVNTEKPDLVILDALMPEMDGHEVLQSLRRNPAARELPVIMVNRRAENNDLFQDQEGRLSNYGRIGKTEYVFIKPFNPTELVLFVERIFMDQDESEANWSEATGRSHADQWQDLRVRVRTFWGMTLGGFILLGALGNLAHGAEYWLVGLWMILSTITVRRINLFRCPHCQDLYFRSWIWEEDWTICDSEITNPFRKRCPHCGLRK